MKFFDQMQVQSATERAYLLSAPIIAQALACGDNQLLFLIDGRARPRRFLCP